MGLISRRRAWVVGLIAVALVAVKRYANGPVCESKARLEGKIVVITGANTGIGKATAEDLVTRGAKVYLACRSSERGQAAADDIKAATGAGDDRVIVMKLDLGSLKSVREFVADFKKRETKLDILINNAGVMWVPYSKTEDGFETTFAVNYLGHFLLTNLLLDLIKTSAPSRVVTVSSLGHDLFSAKLNFDDIMPENGDSTMAYAESKLANILFSKELARRTKGTGVSTYSLHPGSVVTDIMRHSALFQTPVVSTVLLWTLGPFTKSIWHGAQTQICCAVDETLAHETGKYYSDCAEAVPSAAAQDDDAARKLWVLSEKLVGLKEEPQTSSRLDVCGHV